MTAMDTKPKRRGKREKPMPVPLWTDPRHTVEEPSDVAGQPRQRIQRMIDRLERRGLLTARQAEAGRRLHDDWEMIQQAPDRTQPGAAGMQPCRRPVVPAEERIDAAKRYRLALQRAGLRLSPLIVAVVLEDRSVEQFADFAQQDRRRVMGKLDHVLDEIGDVYGLPG